MKSRWWEGPTWLYEDPKGWLGCIPPPEPLDVSKERKKVQVCAKNTDIESITKYWSRFSDYNKIVRIIAWILRFLKRSIHKSSNFAFLMKSILELRKYFSDGR
ncbi:hypothetical protein AVEN_167950-1 [Araneus ventricosus]|uniref:Uncharacterized protein n=1 Tax=Araneus ventricosus TaxID=182803 RepID=A0A4Y2E483_ARAVE|nr:hypothetical protein AVEN_90209-1 [Araneus ventricosus]GBM23133.1 hypothetical protein AVEN_167950-1 [Araneus ventricosus]